MARNLMRDGKYVIARTLCLVMFAVLVNPAIIGRVLSSEVGEGLELTNKIVLWLLSISFLLAAILMYFNGKTSEGRRRILFGYAMAILMLVFVELILHAVFFAAGLFQSDADGLDRRLFHSAYESKSWARQLFEERARAPYEYEPFLGWKKPEFHGKYINLDALGMRKTWNPQFADEKPTKIYMFGGSTLWGMGARDEFTIPSLVSKGLNEGKRAYEVHNYGHSGYVFMQELVKLIQLLIDGHRPDYVVFYDGANDMYAAYQSGSAGAVQNTAMFKAKFRATELSSFGHLFAGVKGVVREHCMIYRAVSRVAETIEGPGVGGEIAARYQPDQLQVLAEETVEYYCELLKLLASLSEGYGFRFLCFWQPVAFAEEKLTPEEVQFAPRLESQNLTDFCKRVYGQIKIVSPENHVNISDALYGRTDSVYIDFTHISEEGNQMVAERIVDALEDGFGFVK